MTFALGVSARDRARRHCAVRGVDGVARAADAADAPAAAGMQSALHAATSTLPHLRRGLSAPHAPSEPSRTCAR